VPQAPLHEHITCVAAPAIWLSPRSGQLAGGVDGLYVADRRVLSRLVVTVGGVRPLPLTAGRRGAAGARFVAVAAGDPDPTLTVERIRTVTPDGGTERILVHNRGRDPVTTTLAITIASDLAPIAAVRAGEDTAGPAVEPLPDGAEWTADDGFWVRLHGSTHCELTLAPGETFATTLTVRATPPRTTGFQARAPREAAPWAGDPLQVRSADHRLDALVAQGIEDLGALLLSDDGDPYCAAGSPWYMTLFGRDSLWTARLALPLGYELAAGTLRALARRQGVRHDPVTEEEPGKIPHELRPAHATNWLPPVYYGTVDATPLFVVTLAEAWRWGMPASEVAALLPAAEKALDWLGSFDGFVSYRGSADKLVNQGWKDSADGIQHADGRSAAPPIALCEVQAYAFQAAMSGADLLDAFGRAGGDRWRRWAGLLAERFRERFWLEDYPAIALDGTGEPVDGPASNLGHLLATGLLTAEEEEKVARRLAELDSGWGLRTLTDRAAGFNPLSYHVGSVWPHDTAIAILGLVRSGHGEIAARLAGGLVAAAPRFGFRLPELFAGYDATDPPTPYPAACSPQAWAAAASPALATALLGLQVDVPAGNVAVRPLPGFGAFSVENMRIGAETFSVSVDSAARFSVVRRSSGSAPAASRTENHAEGGSGTATGRLRWRPDRAEESVASA
jgi:glycogen debranching enzyme